MRNLVVVVVVVVVNFCIISCNSENVNPCEKIELEEIINFEQEKSQLIQKKIYKVDASFIHISFGYTRTAVSLIDVNRKFFPVLNKLRHLIKKFNNTTFLELQLEYEIVYEFSQQYNNISVLNPSILSYGRILENNRNEQVKKYALLNLYNDILFQELLIMEFKYDSLIYAVHDSIGSERNPYESDFVKFLDTPGFSAL